LQVVMQFVNEMEEKAHEFHDSCHDPPVADDLPPISGSIYWSRGIASELADTMRAVELVRPHAADAKHWDAVAALHEQFQGELATYARDRYRQWCERVSDVLARNLTRPLLRVTEEKPVRRYAVNFTTDLADTLAEVRHLETLGFEVPEVARNMSREKARLTGVAEALEVMLGEYHECVEELDAPEMTLLRKEIERVRKALSAGHLRLTWNNQGVHESCLHIGTKAISIFNYRIQQVHLVKRDIERAIETIKGGKLLSLPQAANDKVGRSLPTFHDFHADLTKEMQKEYESMASTAKTIAPSLVKIEEFLFGSRRYHCPTATHHQHCIVSYYDHTFSSLRCADMAAYYAHWERRLYGAVVDMLLANMDAYSNLLADSSPRCTARATLRGSEITMEPDAAGVVEGALSVVRGLVEGTKAFVRNIRGTWIPAREVFSPNSTRPIIPTFYDDVVCLRSVKSRVDTVQKTLTTTVKRAQAQLAHWRSYKSLWLYSKEETCQRFLARSPSCVDFDEKLLFHHNTGRHLAARPNFFDVFSLRLDLSPLKTSILDHVAAWTEALGAQLKVREREREKQ